MITIRQATIDDIPHIMSFIDEHWRKGDTLGNDRDFFEWSFVRNGKVTMVIGVDDETGVLYGIQGFLPYTDDPCPDCAGTIWKTVKSDDPMLGIHLADFMHSNIPMRYYAGAGMRERAIKVAKLRGGVVDRMDHYYRLNSLMHKDDYKIAKIVNPYVPEIEKYSVDFMLIDSSDGVREIIPEDRLYSSVFSKNYGYIDRRYFRHPVYRYDVWKIDGKQCTSPSVMVTRAEEHGGSAICKIIDYFGPIENFRFTGSAFDRLMQEHNYEYVDIYSYGIETKLLEMAGFVERRIESENIIPNYFQPFVQENIEIYLERPWFDNLILFRGDGDQDRPIQ